MQSQSEPLLISDRESAALCGCSRSHWHALAAAGKIPPSVKLGASGFGDAKKSKRGLPPVVLTRERGPRCRRAPAADSR